MNNLVEGLLFPKRLRKRRRLRTKLLNEMFEAVVRNDKKLADELERKTIKLWL